MACVLGWMIAGAFGGAVSASAQDFQLFEVMRQSGLSDEEIAEGLVSTAGTTEDWVSSGVIDGIGKTKEASGADDAAVELTSEYPTLRVSGTGRTWQWSAQLRMMPGTLAAMDLPLAPPPGTSIGNLLPILEPPAPLRWFGDGPVGGNLFGAMTGTEPATAAKPGEMPGLLRVAGQGIFPVDDDGWHQVEISLDIDTLTVRFDGEPVLIQQIAPGERSLHVELFDGSLMLRRMYRTPPSDEIPSRDVFLFNDGRLSTDTVPTGEPTSDVSPSAESESDIVGRCLEMVLRAVKFLRNTFRGFCG
jgi:hypothetical protein